MSRFAAQRFIAVLLSLLLAWPVSAIEFTVEGIKQPNLRDNLHMHLDGLKNESIAIIDPFWQEQLEKTTNRALQPFGYYNAEVTLSQPNDDTVVVKVNVGTPLTVANLTREIIGVGRADPAFRERFNAFPMAIGDVLLQPRYERYKSDMFNYALSHGYFDFFWQVTRLDLVRGQREANVVLIAQSGPRYQFGEIRVVGDDRAGAIIERLAPFEAGEPYTAAKLTEFNRSLNQTGYFARAIARPLVSEADALAVPIEVTIEHLPRDTINVGGGAATDTGPRVRVRWERPWVNSRGHSLTTQLFVSEFDQNIAVDYRIPMQNVSTDYASFGVGYQFYDHTEGRSETLSVSAHRYWREPDSNWQQSLSLTYDDALFRIGDLEEQKTQLLMPGYSISYLDADQELNISNGEHLALSVQIGSEDFGSDINILKATTQAKFIRTFGKHRFVARAEAGIIDTDSFDRVPTTVRFFAGGDQSVRGFGYNTLGPSISYLNDEDELETLVVGGRYLATASIEYAYPVAQDWRAAVFSDVGSASNEFGQDLSYSVGIGAHWLTLIGPVRFYLARGYNELESDWRLRFHFSLGPEL